MRVLSDTAANPNRIVLPILSSFPNNPILGELVFFNEQPHQGIYFFSQEGWLPLYSTKNNYWETIIAEPEQTIFELQQEYDCDGKSINVFKDGIKLDPTDYAEIGRNLIAYKQLDEEGEDIKLEGGEKFEFQIFNVKQTKPFNVKAFNRRNGLSHIS